MNKKQPAVSSNTEDNLEEQALSQLNSGHYKEAIGLYKKLWLESDDEKWQQQLAYCYLQRAISFANRSMVKEALVLWENYSQHTQAPYQAYDHFILWTIDSKNPDKIQSCLENLSAQQLDKQYPALAALLGLLILTTHPEFQQYLPQNSTFIEHLKIAETALEAYQNNNQEKLNETLKRLPYRSAFRDFRTLFNAALSIPEAIEQMQPLLTKIPATSPYAQSAQLLLAYTRKGHELANNLLKFNHKQCRNTAEIIGLNKKQLDFIGDLNRQKDRLSDKVKFNLAIQYQSLCGSELAHQFCQAMLVSYPAGQRVFNKNFSAITKFEKNRIQALILERDNNPYDAKYHWKQCVNTLISDDEDNNLKIALILRHIAEQQGKSEEQAEYYIDSLQYDAEDRDSYLHILNFYSQQQETIQEYKKWLAVTIKKFPQDIDVLTQAIISATRNKAYKKACQYALKILAVDPLNSLAKETLFSSYLAHARRLMLAKKYHLVENEIEHAEALKLGKVLNFETQFLRGLLYFADQHKKQGLKLINESLNKLYSDSVNAHFKITMEALLTGLPVATVLREIPPIKDKLLSEQELVLLIEQLKYYIKDDSNQKLIHKSLEKIKPALKKSLKQHPYVENILLSLCQTLDSINHFELLRHCVKIALAKWKKPIWDYYKHYSETKGMPEQCSQRSIIFLENSREQAMMDKDHRTAVLIDNFLDRYYQANPEYGLDFLDELFGLDNDDDEMEDDLEDPIEALFDHLPEEILEKLSNKMQSLTKKTSPEQLAKELNISLAQDHNLLFAMMQNPDLFTSLIVVKAAKTLNIDIDVSNNDVLAYFGITDNIGTVPF